MNPPPTVFVSRRAFTLIELLVVITIIAVLAGLLLPVANSVMTNARRVTTKNTEEQIITAIKNFRADYGVYPLPADAPTNTDVCFGVNNPTNAELFYILRAINEGTALTVNPRGVAYMELPLAKNQTAGLSKSGIGADGMLYDPWGTLFFVGVDGDYNDTVKNPYSRNAGDVPLHAGVIVYSWGPDKLTTSNFYGGGDKNDKTSLDDVLSWQ